MRILPTINHAESRLLGSEFATSLWRLSNKCAADNVSGAAAAIAFFSLLTAFPGFGVILSFYGLVADPVTVERHLGLASGLLPTAVLRLLSTDVHGFLMFQRHNPGVALTLSLLFTATSGRATVSSLITSLNVVYGKKESRRLLHRHGVGLVLVAAILSFVAITFALVALTPLMIYYVVPLSRGWRHAIDYLRWPVLAVLMIGALTRLYSFAPNRPPQRWLNRGSGVATALWLVFYVAYSYYLSQVGGYNVIYGSVSAPVALLIWLYLSSLAVLLGAEIDALRWEVKTWRTDLPMPRMPSD
jgi:membrane protein